MRSTLTALVHPLEHLASSPELHRVTVFVRKDLVHRATRLHRHDRRTRSTSIVVSFGKPNYRERLRIKTLEKRGAVAVFPFEHVEVWPKKRKTR